MQNGVHKSYPMRTLGPNGPIVSAIGFGTMGEWICIYKTYDTD